MRLHLILLLLFAGLFVLPTFAAEKPKCQYSLSWDLKKEGTLALKGVSSATEFVFLSDDKILIASFPEKNKEQAPLQIYSKTQNGWEYDEKASASLPLVYHVRHMITEDVDGDNIKEVIIADHGTDKPPFPGAYTLVLRNKDGAWIFDSSSKKLGIDLTFNVAVLGLPDGKKAIYKANNAGKYPFFFSHNKQGEWKDESAVLPQELRPYKLCFMTALAQDFDQDGSADLYLGGCDRQTLILEQKHDRILTLQKGKWELQPTKLFPARKLDSKWGTVFSKTFDMNADKKADIILATHDYGFRHWKVSVYQNLSQPGKFKFKEMTIHLIQEKNTEGYVHSLEDFKIKGYNLGILAEVRSVIRDPKMKIPTQSTRFLFQNKKGFVDASACLPEILNNNAYRMRKFPGDSERILLVPFQGDIYSLKVSKK